MKTSSSGPSRRTALHVLRCLLLFALILLLHGVARAVDGTRPMAQYLLQQWGAEQGLAVGHVNAIAQTPVGYLWIGTDRGLMRFNGLRFVPKQPPSPEYSPIERVISLAVDVDGALWIRAENARLLRYFDGRFTLGFPVNQGETSLTAIAPGHRGGLLATGLKIGGMQVTTGGVTRLRPSVGSLLISVAQTTDDTVWLGTREIGLFRWKDGTLQPAVTGVPDRKINCLLPTPDGHLWIGTDNGLGLWNGQTVVTVPFPAEFDHLQILAMVQDRDHNLWLGTSKGLLRYNTAGMAWLQRNARERDQAVTALMEDREGDLWFGNGGSLERLRDSPLITYGDAEQPSGEQFGPTYVDAHGRVWLAPITGGLFWMRDDAIHAVTADGLNQDIVYSIDGSGDNLWLGRQQGGLTRLHSSGDTFTAQTWTHADGLAEDSVFSVRASRDGSVWAGTLTRGASHLVNGKIEARTDGNVLSSETISAIEEDRSGAMWFASPAGVNVLRGTSWRSLGVKDGLPSQQVFSLLADSAGAMWVGTSDGLAYVDKGHVHSFSGSPLGKEPVLGMGVDQRGLLWIATALHIFSAPRAALLAGNLNPETIRSYSVQDGLRSTEGVRRFRSVVNDGLGRVWISTGRGLSVTSSGVGEHLLPAIPHVEEIISDGVAVNLMGDVRVSPNTQRIVFQFSGLDLRAPERVRFRYRLDGFDKAWSEVVESLEAVYTNLPPGRYRFRVVAANSEGRWNAQEGMLSFRVEPMLWQRWEFQLLCLCTLTLISIWIYRRRMQFLITQANMRFDERLVERTRIARELHDTLLQGFISASLHLHVTAEALPSESPVQRSLQRVLLIMERVIEEARQAVKGLRTFDGSSTPRLEQIFRELVLEVDEAEATGYVVVVEGEYRTLRPAIYEEVSRIGREAVINAWRHADAEHVTVRLEYMSGRLGLEVTDDGTGMDVATVSHGREGHWGLLGMRERAERMGARLQIISRLGQGTRIVLNVPAGIAYPDEPWGGRTKEADRFRLW
ncbi:sensor histidine kinase [Granulicella tundricola]|uniref:Histidine kinase n=1 Tax=Granulicella tundricola (strain ATCC BAA-1859 / DSM 23138 / MP5ACTX9) TaxID=1198114 RepID=E8X604_GRATM|nr:sensor histidine kinase [Granulicella tundricola]ADW70888.1 histidine kinase [Granulicella tundricola MP5ACTX9]